MRKSILLFISILICASLVACSKRNVNDNYYENKKEKTQDELGEVSDDEKRILSRGGFYSKDRIYAGELFDSEIEKVKRIRGAKEYLADKYPGQKFKINLYEVGGDKSVSPTGTIGDDTMWISENGENTLTWVKVKETEDGYEYYDNWGTEKTENYSENNEPENNTDNNEVEWNR